MILVDTSIWVEHLRRPDPAMLHLLNENLVLMHPFVLGEIALGSMKNWHGVLRNLGKIPFASKATDNQVLTMIEAQKLSGSGIGFIDAHLVAAAMIHDGHYLWTKDRRLAAVAERLGIDAATA